MEVAALSISDVGVIYASVLSTATAAAGGVAAWWRRRLKVEFSYRWHWNPDEHALVVFVHNDSPARTIHVLELGWLWCHDGEVGDIWSVPAESISVEPGGTYGREFQMPRVFAPIKAVALLGDRKRHDGEPFDINAERDAARAVRVP